MRNRSNRKSQRYSLVNRMRRCRRSQKKNRLQIQMTLYLMLVWVRQNPKQSQRRKKFLCPKFLRLNPLKKQKNLKRVQDLWTRLESMKRRKRKINGRAKVRVNKSHRERVSTEMTRVNPMHQRKTRKKRKRKIKIRVKRKEKAKARKRRREESFTVIAQVLILVRNQAKDPLIGLQMIRALTMEVQRRYLMVVICGNNDPQNFMTLRPLLTIH